jgi:hypothetical protein
MPFEPFHQPYQHCLICWKQRGVTFDAQGVCNECLAFIHRQPAAVKPDTVTRMVAYSLAHPPGMPKPPPAIPLPPPKPVLTRKQAIIDSRGPSRAGKAAAAVVGSMMRASNPAPHVVPPEVARLFGWES